MKAAIPMDADFTAELSAMKVPRSLGFAADVMMAMPNCPSVIEKIWVNYGPSGIMIMKSRMWVNWMPASVRNSQSSRLGDRIRGDVDVILPR